MSKVLKISAIILVAGILTVWFGLPDLRDALIAHVKRLSAPALMLPPNDMKPHPQAQWLEAYRSLGYDLHCNGNPAPQARVSADDDTVCSAIIKSYDGVPADTVDFLFHKSELQHIRIGFPDASMEALQAHLSDAFSKSRRLDQLPGAEMFGKNVHVWPVAEGVVIVPRTVTPNQPVTLVWTSKSSLLRDLEAKKERALQELQKLRENAQSAPTIPTPVVEAAPKPEPAAASPTSSKSARKHGNTRHAMASTHAAPPEADLRKCLDMPTDRDVARCAAH
jgi:hypothetical protein